MKNKVLLSLIVVLLSALVVPAQAQKKRYIYGGLFNAFTREILVGAKVSLLRADSTVVDTMTIKPGHKFAERLPAWYFTVPDDLPQSIVKFELDGYFPTYIDIPAYHFKGRKNTLLFDAYARREPRSQDLGEATVTATKVKFYMKKDTLVFNADAFQLAEGSMLDALIGQLPGVELKDDGRILVNGRQVESLLLNGEDFFKGDNRLMLDNLPSYTVQNVQVYEKQTDVGRMLGKKMGDEPYVMDVKLKKQYSIGWVGNAEAGYSSEGNYLARLFAMRFTPQSRVTVVGNINDVNDNRKPAQNSEWTPEQMPSGLLTTRLAGVDYMVNDKFKRFEVSGNVTARHTDSDNLTRSAGETFLPQGNTYERSERRNRRHDINVSTGHTFKFMHENSVTLLFKPSYSYSTWRARYASAAATFSALPGVTDVAALIDSIRRPDAGNLLRRLAVNRTITESFGDGRTHNGGLSFNGDFKTGVGDLVSVSASVWGNDTRGDSYEHYRLDYPATGGATDYRNNWNKNRPYRDLNASAGINYMIWVAGNTNIRPGYDFGYSSSRRDNTLYRLDRLAGWGLDDDAPLGLLPSEQDVLTDALDTQNSEERLQTDLSHTARVVLEHHKFYDEGDRRFSFYTYLPLTMTHSRLDYKRHTYDGITTRNTTFFNPRVSVTYKWHGQARSVDFSYRLSHSAPDMANLIDLENDVDPLNIYLGNAALKNTATHVVSLSHSNNSGRKQRYFNVSANWRVSSNAVAWGYVYDRTTGVRTYRPDNVSGNYTLSGGLNYAMPLDRAKRLNFSTGTFAQVYHGVDLISTTSGVAPARSTTDVYWVTESLKFDYRMGKVKAGVKAYCSWNRPTSDRADFEAFTVWDFNYGPTVQVDLPWDLQLATDLTLYSRRGYEDAAANTDDLMWNARLAKRALRGNLTFAVDAFDILGQLSNLTQTVNSQGRFETWRNVTPRYVMFHVIYRLNIRPKQQPGT